MASASNNTLDISSRAELRSWLEEHHASESECWLVLKYGRPADDSCLYYLDAVEEALCFGWIDSTRKIIDGITMQRFTPRKPRSQWSELNKERVRRLEKLGLMTDAGRAALPPMGPRSFRIDPDVVAALKAARCWSGFKRTHPLYQRIRSHNIQIYKCSRPDVYERSLAKLIESLKQGRAYGQWNDYGRLIEY